MRSCSGDEELSVLFQPNSLVTNELDSLLSDIHNIVWKQKRKSIDEASNNNVEPHDGENSADKTHQKMFI